MSALDAFPITRRWPAADPTVIQLYSFPTPNGVKVSIALEELGLPYEAHRISIMDNDQMTPEFLSLNPNNKIPAIIDPNGPDGTPLALFESGAILLWLAEKTGKLLPADPAARLETLQWLFFQIGGVGPMFGQFGYFYKFAGSKMEDPHARDRYRGETRRLLGVLEKRLEGRDFIAGSDYSIADIALFPWVRTLRDFYAASDVLALPEYARVMSWMETCLARPASQRGITIPAAN